MPLLRLIELILPALIPSWNFFDVIVPSPRLEACVLTDEKTPQIWQEVRPRPESLSGYRMLRRMFWNARWNEHLYMVSLAERMIACPTLHSYQQILLRIYQELTEQQALTDSKWLRFRLVFVRREGDRLVEDIGFESENILIERLS